ncbi:hypothetical protein J5N97_029396 [Dioscorea zingiberensis]|uniref:RING-type domain-containing protein n=1 Tax=Dioscorea zingiberensis TaxID=325984 RepID=A0A9D5C0V1_9LILI|nr:hypothetical protein J5N97_029396 [Dioscorea zingiberensis]
MAFIIILVVCAKVLTFIAHAAIHFLLRRCRQRSTSNEHKPPTPLNDDELIMAKPPSLLFSQETNLAGAELECAICLAEFAEGDGLRVLPLCRHAFHVNLADSYNSDCISFYKLHQAYGTVGCSTGELRVIRVCCCCELSPFEALLD